MLFGLFVGLLVELAAPAAAQVRWKTGPDGRRVMVNDGAKRRVPRTAPPVQAQPAADTIDVNAVVDRYSKLYRVDPKLVHSVIRVESSYNAGAVSHKGAIGLMQLMPQTARELAVDDPYDPEQNVRGGTLYLRSMLDRFDENLEWALAAYNAGPTAVDRFGGIPPYDETIDYVEKVIRLYRGDTDFTLPRNIRRSRGRKTYLVRKDGRLVMTTSRPR